MEFNYSYQKDSLIDNDASQTKMSFAPDTTREPTFFRGEIRSHLPFREAVSALHEVVVSDMRWQPKDRSAYKKWLEGQEEIDWAEVAAQRKEVAQKLRQVREELDDLRKRSAERMKSFYRARQQYFDYLYRIDRDAWIVLDPVVSVHPDEVFLECFSRDESSYGRLSVDFSAFRDVGDFSCGTTNIDYSALLYDEFQKIRSYKNTQFEIDPTGFEVKTSGEAAYKEVKIDLPDSWVRGFLQVSSAMVLPAASVQLHPMDVHNICLILRRRKEIKGPRSMRYQLKPGQPVRIVFDPWNHTLECPRSIYSGDEEEEIRVWGRRRIHILERLIPVAKRFTVTLLGKGMPSFYSADLGDMTFTLGLSGWSANDWSTAGNFDLLAPRARVDTQTKQRVFEALRENWFETPDSLSNRLGLERSVVLGSLAAYTQAGRAIWDPIKSVYRVRELSREPLPLKRLRFESEREQNAARLVDDNCVKVETSFVDSDGALLVEGGVREKERHHQTTLRIDHDERIIAASCTCNFHQQNKLRMGPCEHILGLRLLHKRASVPPRLLSLTR